jgi:hypothetical protein
VRSPDPVIDGTHAPLTQFCPEGQTLLHAPQCAVLVCVFTHIPEQLVCPMGHPPPMHMPAVHVCPVAQATPQPPQFVVLLVRSTHVPAQRNCPEGQAVGGLGNCASWPPIAAP